MRLVAVPEGLENYLAPLKELAYLVSFSELEKRKAELLPQVEAMIVLSWPSFLDKETVSKMKKLRFVQSILVGVNHIPMNYLPKSTIVCSNSGAYSLEVAEYTWAFILYCAKRISFLDYEIKKGGHGIEDFRSELNKIKVLDGANIGIVGFGSIGRRIAEIARTFDMKIHAFVRKSARERDIEFYSGKSGLRKMLSVSDYVVISLPLTKETKNMIGKEELSVMKENAVLVNIARGDIVDQEALYNHLLKNKDFYYATDVWWTDNGKETLETKFPFHSLQNFICTPHISGPTALLRGLPFKNAVENTIRYLKGINPNNIVNKEEY